MPAQSPIEPVAGAPRSTPPSDAAHAPQVRRLFAALTKLQIERPATVLLVALATVVLAAVGASHLTLKTSLGELLPENKESVIVAEQVNKRLVASSTFVVVAEGEDATALKRFVDALAPELRTLPSDMVGLVDDGVRESQAFFEQNKLLYAPLKDVQRVHDEIIERYDRAVRERAGLELDLDDDDKAGGSATDSSPLTAESVRAQIAAAAGELAAKDSFPDGYYMEPDGHLIALIVRTPISGGDVDRSRELRRRVEEVIAKVDPGRFDPSMKVNFTGNLITSLEEYSQIAGDLLDVGVWGVAMILGVVFLFYLRIRTLLAMSLSVGIGAVWTFGLTDVLVGHLNASTGFLVSIIVGNGINFAIIYMARYLEVRREQAVAAAVLSAHLETWIATLAAAGAATVAYGSLVVTDFRGFKHFGIIGGSGMLLCWLATYLFLPSILAVSERVYAVRPDVGIAARLRAGYGRPFAFLAQRYPRVVAISAVLTGIAGAALAFNYIAADPMEYDMSQTRTEPKTGLTVARTLMSRVDKIVGRQSQDGLAIAVDRLDQVRPLHEALDAKRAAAPEGQKPFDKVADIFDLLPKDQEKKIELIAAARDRLERAHRRGIIEERDWAEIRKHIPGGVLRPIGIDDLPEQVARMFVEKDGTRGRLVYIVPSTGRSVWDGRYLIEWADSFRSTKLPDGSVIKGSGNAVIFADVLIAVVEDAPKAILVSILGTLLIIVLAFRGRAASLAVVATLALGLVWMMSALALYDVKIKAGGGGLPHVELVGLKLNFLNFITLPIAVGFGADYSINVMQRYKLSGSTRIHDVIVETGGAVILCSLTTTLGYFALTFSINKAIVSFGYSAAAGELSCVLAAVLVLPAFLVWRDQRRAARSRAGAHAGSAEARVQAPTHAPTHAPTDRNRLPTEHSNEG